jgi:hypothetical protein
MQRLIAPIAMAGILASGCGAAATATPTATTTALPTDTPSLAATATATATPAPTADASGSAAASGSLVASGSAVASATAGPTLEPGNQTPPPKLPKGNAGVILKVGDCFDMDAWVVTAGPTPGLTCDLRLNDDLFMEPVNAARLAGKSQATTPTLFDCQAADLGRAPVAPGLNTYLCLRTNAGAIGFVVQREDRPTAPEGRIIVDYWLYK